MRWYSAAVAANAVINPAPFLGLPPPAEVCAACDAASCTGRWHQRWQSLAAEDRRWLTTLLFGAIFVLGAAVAVANVATIRRSRPQAAGEQIEMIEGPHAGPDEL